MSKMLIWGLFALAVIVGMADIGLNLLSLIPWVGTAFETMTEIVAEFIQGLIIMIMAILYSMADE